LRDEDGQVRITHIYALVTFVTLDDIIAVIKEYGFKASEYPLILSLEDHCSAEMQTRVVKKFKGK
jgi:hypothetical protein